MSDQKQRTEWEEFELWQSTEPPQVRSAYKLGKKAGEARSKKWHKADALQEAAAALMTDPFFPVHATKADVKAWLLRRAEQEKRKS